MLNHSTGFDHELDDKIQDFYDRIAALIKRSLDLGIEMNLVRNSDTRAVSYAILGGIKEVIGMLSRSEDTDIDRRWSKKYSQFGLGGVARPELLKFVPSRREAASDRHTGQSLFFWA